MIGCEDSNTILEPTNDLSEVSLNKGRIILDRDLDDFEDLTDYKVHYTQSYTIWWKYCCNPSMEKSRWITSQIKSKIIYS